MWKIAVTCTVVCALCLTVKANDWSENSGSDQSRIFLGAYEDVDKNSPGIQDVAKFATSEIAAGLDSPNGFNLVNVNGAKKQVVAGVNYYLSITVIPNQCEREGDIGGQDDQKNASCPPGTCDNALACDVTVYAIPWLHQMKLDGFTCKPDPSTCPKDPASY